MKFINSLIIAALTLSATSAFADEGGEYDLVCEFKGSKFAPVEFRLEGRYLVLGDGTGELDISRGLLFTQDLGVIEVYQSKRDPILNDKTYKPRDAKWKKHFQFKLDSIGPEMMTSSGGTNALIIAREPSSKKEKRITGVPNPGTEITSTFHAGLQYYDGDYGNRTEVKCTGTQYISDRERERDGE